MNVGNAAWSGAPLSARVFRSSWISLGGQAMQGVVRLGSTIVLARLLTPDAYGLVAMVAVLTGFIGLFKSLGLATATIQAPDLTEEDLNSLFWVNAGVGVAAMAITTAFGPVLAWLYNEPRVIGLTIALSSTFLLAGLGVQHGALLRRQFRFGTSVSIEVAAVAAGAVTAVTLAANAFGPWSLVGGVVATEAVSLVLVWSATDWRPARPGFDPATWRLVALGRDLTQFNVLNYWARNLDNFLIGRYWGAIELGFYGRAYQLLLLPLQQVTTPLSPVAIAALSRLQDDDKRFRQAYMRILEKVAMACLPLTTFMFFNSTEVVRIALGPRWLGAAPIFMALAGAGLVQPISATFIWLLISQGRRAELRRWSILGSALSCAAIAAGLSGGGVGVATAYAACEVAVRAPLLAWMVGRRGPVRVADMLRAISPGAAAAASVAATCGLLGLAGPSGGPVWLLASLTLSMTAAAATFALLPSGRRAFMDVWGVMRPRRATAGSSDRPEGRAEAVLL